MVQSVMNDVGSPVLGKKKTNEKVIQVLQYNVIKVKVVKSKTVSINEKERNKGLHHAVNEGITTLRDVTTLET